MSRIGKMPITVPAGVEVTIADGNLVTVKGPKGTLTSKFHHDMIIKQEGAVLTVSRPDEEHEHKSLHGLTRTLHPRRERLPHQLQPRHGSVQRSSDL